MAYEIRQGDRRPHYRIQLTGNGVPVDLTGAVSVHFIMKPAAGGTAVVDTDGTIITPATGVVEYAWDADDTTTSGSFAMKVRVVWGGGETQTFPSSGSFAVTIQPDV